MNTRTQTTITKSRCVKLLLHTTISEILQHTQSPALVCFDSVVSPRFLLSHSANRTYLRHWLCVSGTLRVGNRLISWCNTHPDEKIHIHAVPVPAATVSKLALLGNLSLWTPRTRPPSISEQKFQLLDENLVSPRGIKHVSSELFLSHIWVRNPTPNLPVWRWSTLPLCSAALTVSLGFGSSLN